MFERLVIIGASGQGKVIADIALKTKKYKEIYFLDDDVDRKECIGFPVVGDMSCMQTYIENAEFFVAIGDAGIRKRITDELMKLRAHIATLIHPMACIGTCVEIGKGTAVMAGAVINSGTTIGEGNIINTCSSVDHDCVVGDYVHVAVGAHLCGTVTVGNNTWIGAGAVIKHGISVVDDCMIGLGAMVVKNIDEPGTYIGVPARKIN